MIHIPSPGLHQVFARRAPTAAPRQGPGQLRKSSPWLSRVLTALLVCLGIPIGQPALGQPALDQRPRLPEIPAHGFTRTLYVGGISAYFDNRALFDEPIFEGKDMPLYEIPAEPKCGNPIGVANGVKVQEDIDFETPGNPALSLMRRYSSAADRSAKGLFGERWSSSVEHFLVKSNCASNMADGNSSCGASHKSITVVTDGGARYTFHRHLSLDEFVNAEDAFSKLTHVPATGGHLLKRADNSEIMFRSDGRVDYVADGLGTRWQYTYTTNQIRVRRSNSTREMVLNLSPTRRLVTTVVEPGGQTYTYDYDPIPKDRLKLVDYPGSATDSRQYRYRANAPEFLEGIDIGGQVFASFTYYEDDSDWRFGRGKSSEHMGGAEKTTFEYDVLSDGLNNIPITHVTNALNLKTTYRFEVEGSRLKLKTMSRNASANCAAAAQGYFYDLHGHLDYIMGFDGIKTDFHFEPNGQLTRTLEGIDTVEAPAGRRYVEYIWDNFNRVQTMTTGEIDLGAQQPERDISKIEYVYGAATTATQSSAGDVQNHLKSITETSLVGSAVTRATEYSYLIHPPVAGNSSVALHTMYVDGPTPGTGDRVTTRYAANGDLLSTANELAHTTYFQSYNARGQAQTAISPNSDQVDMAFDARGRVGSETRSYGGGPKTTVYEYDRFGNVAKQKTPGAPEQWFTYDAANRLTRSQSVSFTDSTESSYDSRDVMIDYNSLSAATVITTGATRSVAGMGGGTCTTIESVEHRTTDELGQVLTIAPARYATGNSPSFVCANQLSEPGPVLKRFQYDNVGRITSITDPSGTTTIDFDSLGRPSSQTDAQFHTTYFSYGFAHNKLGQVLGRYFAVEPPEGGATVQRFNGLGLLMSEESPDREADISYSYDPDGRLSFRTESSDGLTGVSVEYGYDVIGRVKTETYRAMQPGRPGAGSPWPSNQVLANELGSVIAASMVSSPSPNVTPHPSHVNTFEYDACTGGIGRVCSTIRGKGKSWQSSYTYGPYGALSSISEAPHEDDGSWQTVVGFGHDEFGRPSTVAYPSGNVITYLYSSGVLRGITANVPGGSQTVVDLIKYRASGMASGLRFGNGLVRSVQEGDRLDGQPKMIATGSVQSLEYDYDSTNRVERITNNVSPLATQRYLYDSNSRLTDSQRSGVNEIWGLDTIGNRKTHQRGSSFWNLEYDGTRINKLSRPTYERSYLYTPMGNLQAHEDGTLPTAFAYHNSHLNYTFRPYATPNVCDPATGLCSTKPAGVWEYGTNLSRQRVFKSEQGIKGLNSNCSTAGFVTDCLPEETEAHWLRQFAYDVQGNLLHENYRPGFDHPNGQDDYSAATSKTDYVWLQGQPIAIIRNGQMFYIANDHLGRPEVVTNTSQQVVWRAHNFAFHREVATTSIGELNLGLPGQYSDAETALWYNWHRYYDPSTGRYIQSDPIGLAGGLNTYAYVNSDPVGAVDPTGLSIYLQFHEVLAERYHGKIVVVPDNTARWGNHAAFRKNGFATFGGGPDGMFRPLGPLHGGINRPNDVSEGSAECHKLDLMHGLSEDEVIERLLALTAGFQSGAMPNYSTFPASSSEYNSNSYIHGLGLSAGLWMPFPEQISVAAPGYRNPLPSDYFSR